jgi:hypothetical protein
MLLRLLPNRISWLAASLAVVVHTENFVRIDKKYVTTV